MKTEEPRIHITDLGDRRRVELFGHLRSFEERLSSHLVFETTYSAELIRLIARNQSINYLKDNIDRQSHPDYLLGPMRRLITRFIDPERPEPRHVLDFGCGAGGTTVNLARIFPRGRITGVDISPKLLEVAEALARELKMEDRIAVRRVDADGPLPFPSQSFDVIVCGGVIEHVHPRLRPRCLGEIWRVLRQGGHLFIRETPNRFFPFEGHTSLLLFAHWLPLRLSAPLVRALSPRKLADKSNRWLVDAGFVGPTYYEILRAIHVGGGRPRDLTRTSTHCVNDFFFYWLKKEKGALRRLIKLLVREGYHVLERLARPLGVPIAAFLPSLELCICKDG